MTVTIRQARIEDAGPLSALLRAVGWFHFMETESPADTSARVCALLRQCLKDDSHFVLVAVAADEQVVGYLSIHWLPYLFLKGPEGFISELFVHPQARGQGIGAQLLDAAQEEARKRGCFRLHLLNNRNRESYLRKFYEKQGWQERAAMASFLLSLE